MRRCVYCGKGTKGRRQLCDLCRAVHRTPSREVAKQERVGLDIEHRQSVGSGFEVTEHDLPANVVRQLRDRGLM